MLSHALLALCGVTGVLGQTTYSSPFLAQFLILSDFSVSTVGGDATHTTYNVKCDRDITLCSLPATGVTVMTAPSSVGLSFTSPAETFTSSVGCTYIDSRVSAVCVTMIAAPGETVQSGSLVTSMVTVRTTTTLPAASVELGFNTPVATAAALTTAKTEPATRSVPTGSVAAKTSTATSETKTGGATEAFGRGNAGLVAGAAILGLGSM